MIYLHPNKKNLLLELKCALSSKTPCLDVHAALRLSMNCRCKYSANSSCCQGGKWNGLSSWKNKCCVGSLKWCSTGSLESHSVFGNTTVCVFFQHSLLDEGPFHRHYGLIFGRIPPGSSKTGCLTSRITIESSLVINQDREDWRWPAFLCRFITWVLLKNKIWVHIVLQVSGTHGQINN